MWIGRSEATCRWQFQHRHATAHDVDKKIKEWQLPAAAWMILSRITESTGRFHVGEGDNEAQFLSLNDCCGCCAAGCMEGQEWEWRPGLPTVFHVRNGGELGLGRCWWRQAGFATSSGSASDMSRDGWEIGGKKRLWLGWWANLERGEREGGNTGLKDAVRAWCVHASGGV